MPDETGTTTEETTTATVETTAVAPKVLDFLEADGSFKPGWVEALTPEDFRNPGDQIAYRSVGGIKDVLKQLAHQNRTIQKQGKGILPLGEKATPTEVEIYRRSMGIPEAPEGYNVRAPEGLADYYDDEGMRETLAAFHAANLAPAQVKAVMDIDAKRLKDGIAAQEAAAATARAETETALKELWGEKFEPNLRLANRVIAETVPDEDKEAVLALIGNSVPVATWIAKLGEAFLEDTVVNTDGDRPGTATSEIERLESTPGYADGTLRRTDRKKHDEIVARLATLYACKYPEPAATT
jgi:hypothetical protein